MSSVTLKSEFETDAAIFKLLAAFYNVNPSEALLSAAGELQASEDSSLAGCINSIKTCESGLTELKVEWTKLFRGVSPDYGPMPPYEHEYMQGSLTALLKELAQTYAEAGFDAQGERQDYIGTELAFLSHLADKAAQALEDNDMTSFEKYAAFFERFLQEHPAQWFGAFMQKAMPYAESGFYKGTLELTEFCLT